MGVVVAILYMAFDIRLIIRHPDHEYGWWVYVFKKKHLGVNTAS
jgi:hypothetical protein